MEEAKPISTPVNVNSKLVKASEESESADQASPQWAACSICPLEHDLILHLQWTAVKRILRYLKGTTQFG